MSSNSLHHHIIIKLFKLNMRTLVCYFYFTTLLHKKGLIYFELLLRWPYWPKSDVKNQTYLLTALLGNSVHKVMHHTGFCLLAPTIKYCGPIPQSTSRFKRSLLTWAMVFSVTVRISMTMSAASVYTSVYICLLFKQNKQL